MGFLDSLFSGVKVFVNEAFTAVTEPVKVALYEIDNSSFGRAATQLLQGATRKYFSDAADLAEEERELASKYQRDGHRTEIDAERLQEIATERSRLKRDLDAARVQEAAQELREQKESIISAPVNDDEASAALESWHPKHVKNVGRRCESGRAPTTIKRNGEIFSGNALQTALPQYKARPARRICTRNAKARPKS